MRVYNIHQRSIDAPAVTVGALIDTLASEVDRLWPHETWPQLRFDRPGLVIGGVGGHGPVGYWVEHDEPGRSVLFHFTGRPVGLWGTHQFLVQEVGPKASVLWHVTEVRARGRMCVTWFVFWRVLHDALIEDSLYKAAREALPDEIHRRPKWNAYVRFLRWARAMANLRRGAQNRTAGHQTPPSGSRRAPLHLVGGTG